jgi:hypothetical protein
MDNLLHQTGEALYGPQWQSPLARALAVNVRTVQRWASGRNEPPPSIWQAIREIVVDRQADLDALLDPLGKSATP